MFDLIRDHKGKTSQGRVSALAGMGTACALATAPLWGGPPPDIMVLGVLIGAPSGFALWQKGVAEKPKADE